MDGFIGKRTLDPGASVGANTSFISVVDIRTVRLVINVVEKDLRRIQQGTAVEVEVDAYPGENFNGRVARVAPILDPATRTAQVEIEIPNATYRLKPGMYARARFTVEQHDNALVVPTPSVVDLQGKIGVWMPGEGDTRGIQSDRRRHRAAGIHRSDERPQRGPAGHLDRRRSAAALAIASFSWARLPRAPGAVRAVADAAGGRAGGAAGGRGRGAATTNANRGQQPGQ